MDINAARARLLELYLTQDNLKAQLKAVSLEVRDTRNFIAGHEATNASSTPEPQPE